MSCSNQLLLLVLVLPLVCYTSNAENSVQGSRHQRDAEISSIRKCANSLSGCPAPPPSKQRPAKCNQTSDCTNNQYCHSIFKMCLAPLKSAPPRRKMPHEPICTSNEDCGIDQECHAFFRRCFDRLPKASAAPRTRRISANCVNTTDCSSGQFCHEFFHICLNQTSAALPPPTTPSWRCGSDSDCGPSEFCHNLTHFCLRLLNTKRPTSSPKNGQARFCLTDSDCKLSEICHFLIGITRSQRKSQGTHPNPRPLSNGICIPNKQLHSAKMPAVAAKPSNCSRGCDGSGCCLESMGICTGYRLKGEICITEDVPFLCPCVTGYECVSLNRTMGMKKLRRKIAFPAQVLAERASWKRLKFKVGKCRRKS